MKTLKENAKLSEDGAWLYVEVDSPLADALILGGGETCPDCGGSGYRADGGGGTTLCENEAHMPGATVLVTNLEQCAKATRGIFLDYGLRVPPVARREALCKAVLEAAGLVTSDDGPYRIQEYPESLTVLVDGGGLSLHAGDTIYIIKRRNQIHPFRTRRDRERYFRDQANACADAIADEKRRGR